MNGKKRALIELKNAGLCYRLKGQFLKNKASDFWAVRGLDLKIHDGDRLAVVGRNGAGKSTLMSILAGTVLPDEGQIRVKQVSRQLLTLQLGFDPYMTGEENAILGGLYLGKTLGQMKKALPRIYEMCELGDFFHQPLRSYSSGMKARLGFAVAMEATPEVLLLDEVLGTVGDDAFKKKSSEVLRQKMEKHIKTLVVVSHNEPVLKELCNRAILLESGKIVHDGTVEEVFEQYQKLLDTPGRNVKSASKKLKSPKLALQLRLFKKLIEICS